MFEDIKLLPNPHSMRQAVNIVIAVERMKHFKQMSSAKFCEEALIGALILENVIKESIKRTSTIPNTFNRTLLEEKQRFNQLSNSSDGTELNDCAHFDELDCPDPLAMSCQCNMFEDIELELLPHPHSMRQAVNIIIAVERMKHFKQMSSAKF
ncbi:Interleukin-1 beta [Labeo rohita]|uniref:Interleukin-1 beta n=1 Tax=Labeo rohita TaxID=84645 RepID=A0ABQ8MBN9_LABRO|nr:Interleukin-1 beta [Labeo rohita]